ncbi:hypothetical protein ACERIT_01090 [Halopenitus sp. H-Gu1]|uniref:hypothetical protein n=1 Tax=Halopenitus sp. H-Gu1 TaxID=3242697 RepID=UPI00359EE6C5
MVGIIASIGAVVFGDRRTGISRLRKDSRLAIRDGTGRLNLTVHSYGGDASPPTASDCIDATGRVPASSETWATSEYHGYSEYLQRVLDMIASCE